MEDRNISRNLYNLVEQLETSLDYIQEVTSLITIFDESTEHILSVGHMYQNEVLLGYSRHMVHQINKVYDMLSNLYDEFESCYKSSFGGAVS